MKRVFQIFQGKEVYIYCKIFGQMYSPADKFPLGRKPLKGFS